MTSKRFCASLVSLASSLISVDVTLNRSPAETPVTPCEVQTAVAGSSSAAPQALTIPAATEQLRN